MLFSNLLGNLNGSNKIVKEIQEIKSQLGGESVDIEVNPKEGKGFKAFWDALKSSYQDTINAQTNFNKVLEDGFKTENIDSYIEALGNLSDKEKINIINSSKLKDSEKALLTERIKNMSATKFDTEVTEENTRKTQENTAANLENSASDVVDSGTNAVNIDSTKLDSEVTDENTRKTLENAAANLENAGTDAVDTGTNNLGKLGELAEKFGSTFAKILPIIQGAGIAFASLAAIIGGSFVVSNLIEEKKLKKIEKIKKDAEEAKSAIDELKSTFEEKREKTEDIIDRFTELSEGVDTFTGKNKTLSTDEYEEFLDLNSQLLELFPDLSATYDENGNAIVDLNGDVNTFTESLKQLVEMERELTNQEIVKKLPTVFEGLKTSTSEAKNTLGFLESYVETQENALKQVQEINSELDKGYIEVSAQDEESFRQLFGNYLEAVQKSTADYSLGEIFSDENGYTQKIYLETDDESVKESIKNNVDAWQSEADIEANIDLAIRDISTVKNDINSEWSLLSNSLTAWLSTESDDYQMLSDSMRIIVQKAINNLEYSELDFDNLEEAQQYVLDNIVGLFSDNSAQSALNSLFELDFSEMSPKETEAAIMQYINEIVKIAEGLEIEGIDSDLLLKTFGLNGYIDFAENYKVVTGDIVKEVGRSYGGTRDSEFQAKIDQFAKQYSINTQDELAAFNDAWEKANGDLDKAFEIYLQKLNEKNKKKTFEEVFNAESFSEQKEELLELARAGEITYDVLESTDEYRTLLDETGLSAKEVKGEIMSLLSATELLAAASKGTEPLIGAYEEYVEKGFVTAEILEGMADTYKELASWEDFKVTAGDPTKTKAEIQEVFNKLLTEWYIDQDILDGLTEENQEIHIANMEDDNIINAREATDKYLSNKVLFTEAADEYKRHLEAGKESYEDYIKNKGQLDEEYLTSIGNANAELFNLYGKYYSDDLENYATLIANKMKLEARLAELKTNLANTFGEDFVYDPTKNEVENLEANGLVAHGNNIAALRSYIEALNYNKEKLAETESEINDILYVGLEDIISMDFDGISAGINSSSDTVFDHIETRLNHLNEELEKTKETAEDAFSDWGDRSNAYKTASTQIDQLIEAQKKAKARYQAEANKSGISDSDRQLVEKGDLSIIETLSDDDPRKKQIESYKEWYDKVKACDDAILQLEKDSKEWDRTFRAFRWETFDTLVDQISRLSEEAEYLIGLLAEEDLFDDSGNMTEYATATLGLHLSNIDTYKQLAQDQLDEINTLQKEIKDGGADQETIDRYNELIDAHRDNINAIKDEENAILDLVEQGYQKQLEALQEIIDKKKESLNAEKDLYDYQKSIEEKTKKVSSLQKQYDVYKNDDSEEGIAQAQRIKLELEEAKSDLEQTEYEKYLSDQESLMDNLVSDYEEWMDARLEDENRLLTEIRDMIAGKSDSILNTLNTVATENDTVLSDEIETSIVEGATTAIDNIADAVVNALGGDDEHKGNAGTHKAYAKGTKRSGKEWAWTQEKGVELIRTKDGALLTPLDNSMVFNNESSRRLWEFSQNPVDYLNKLGMQNVAPQINVIAPKMPELSRMQTSGVENNTTYMEVVLPNVTNYDEFINRMQSDKRFDKMITTSMNSKMTGGNSLNKFRY